MTFPFSPLPLVVQYLVALAYSLVADAISLGYYFARNQDFLTRSGSGENLYSLYMQLESLKEVKCCEVLNTYLLNMLKSYW